FDRDLFGREPIEDCTTVHAPVVLRWPTEGNDDLVEPATSGVIGNIHFGSKLLNIAPVLDEQLHKIELLTGQPTDPTQAKPSFDDNAAFRAFQTSDNKLSPTYRVS